MKITRIETQRKRPGRKNLYADGAFLIGVGSETLIKFGLRTGDEITPVLLRELQRSEELLGAKNAALRLLATRPRSEKEVRNRLRDKEYGDEEIDLAIGELTKAGLLDDSEFARAFIRNALALRPVGPVMLKRKLLLLGVDNAIVDDALQAILSDTDLAAGAERAAASFVKKALSARRPPDGVQLRQRLTAFLMRRGYTWSVIESVVKKAVGRRERDDGEIS